MVLVGKSIRYRSKGESKSEGSGHHWNGAAISEHCTQGQMQCLLGIWDGQTHTYILSLCLSISLLEKQKLGGEKAVTNFCIFM
jgi:hypothetical protein